MFLSTGRASARHRHLCSLQLVFASLLLCITCIPTRAQGGGVDFTGTGGKHRILGRLYFPSGRRADATIKINLESTSSERLSVLADANGSFTFNSIAPGSYTLTVDAGEGYEIARESIYIDGPVRSRSMSGAEVERANVARSINVPIYLQPKRHGATAKPGVLNAALASVPVPARDLYTKALESAQSGDSKKAIEQLKSALSYYPDFALALNELGVQYLRIGQPERAVEALRSAVKITPDAFTPRLNYGIALLEKKELAEAEKQLRQALTRNETSPTAHLYLGIALINLRHYDDAQKELERAIFVGGDTLAPAHYYLGGLLWSKKEYKRAADELEKYLKLVPNAPKADQIRATIKELRNKN